MCRAENIWYAYKPEQWVLRDVSIQTPAEGFLTIMGPSGSGKTTLIKVMAAMIPAQKGRVELMGQTVNGDIPHSVRKKVGYIPQQLGLVRGSSALENVLLGALGRLTGVAPLLGLFPKREVEMAHDYLAAMGMGHKAGEKVYRLSGGERQRVAIARTLMQQPKVIFADEFVSDLDMPRAMKILESVRELIQRDKIPFVMNLHNLPLVMEIGDQIAVLKHGAIIHHGNAHDLPLPTLRQVLA